MITSKIRRYPARLSALLVLSILILANAIPFQKAFATTYMTHASVIEYNMVSSGSGEFAIAFTAGASDAAGSVTINFGSGGTVAATQTVTTTGCTALTGASTALPGTTFAGTAGSGTTVTIGTVGALTAGTSYCAILTSASAVTNTATPGQYTAVITDGTDTATVGTDVIGNDQVTVQATVPTSFTMALHSASDNFSSNLSATALSTTGGDYATIGTNANSGWGLWAMDTNAGLHSATESKTIASVTPGSNITMNGAKIGTEAYALGVTSVTGGGTANAYYADASNITGGGLSNTAYNEIASDTTASASSQVNTQELADIAATTPAAQDYTDTIDFVGAGSF